MSKYIVRKESELTDFERLGLVDFSYSRMDTYLSCPAQYFYSYIQKEPRRFGAAATLGNIIHSALENQVEKDRPLDFRELKTEYLNQIPLWDPDDLIPRDLISIGHTIIDEFFDRHSNEKFPVYETELGFSFVIGSYRINGFIDRVDLPDDNRVIITDYKSGKWEVSDKTIATNLQLGIYALVGSILFPGRQVYAELYYLRSGKRKGHTFTPEELEIVKERIVETANVIINDNSFHPTQQVFRCGFCDHAASGACGTGVYRNMKKANK